MMNQQEYLTLNTKIATANTLILTIAFPQNKKVLSAQIHYPFCQSHQYSKLANWFDNIQQLQDHLKSKDNYKIDLQNKCVQIIGRHPTKKGTNIVIEKIKMNQQKNNDHYEQQNEQIGKGQLENILGICQRNEQIKDKDIKQILKVIINKLLIQQNNKTQNLKKYKPHSQYEDNETSKKYYEAIQQIQKIKQQLNNLRRVTQTSKISDIPSYVSQSSQKQYSSNKSNSKNDIKTSTSIQNMQYRNSLNIQRLSQQIKQKDEVVQIIINKLKNYSDQVDTKIQKLYDRVQSVQTKLEEITNHVSKELKGVIFVDQGCASFNRLSINGNIITKVGGHQADVFLKTKIKQKNTFSIRILNLKQTICIGIADQNLKTLQSFVNAPNCVVYYSDGNFYNGSALRGKIFKKFGPGDVINVSVNLIQGKIDFRLGGQLRVSYTYQKIKDQKINWVPYIWILGNNDSIYIID